MLLASDMSRIQNLDLEGDVDIHSRISEVASMKTAVDNMKSGLRSFQKYVPSELVAELIKLRKEAVLGVEKRELSVFFSDIAGFTTISESLPPERLARNMGAYFEGMTSALLRNKATVDKYIGDAIMAFWGARDRRKQPRRAGVQSRPSVSEFRPTPLSADLVKAGMPPLTTRIGINSGEAIVGNMGYKDRLSYTAIGDNVNLASRLEGTEQALWHKNAPERGHIRHRPRRIRRQNRGHRRRQRQDQWLQNLRAYWRGRAPWTRAVLISRPYAKRVSLYILAESGPRPTRRSRRRWRSGPATSPCSILRSPAAKPTRGHPPPRTGQA